MIVEADGRRFRGADVYVVFRELWWAAKGTGLYSDERLDFIFNLMQAMASDAVGSVAGAEPGETGDAVAALMRRVETERLNTPAHLLALGGLLGRYVLSDESPRDTRELVAARATLRQAWWSSGLDSNLLGPGA
jgi:hypothetical protein